MTPQILPRLQYAERATTFTRLSYQAWRLLDDDHHASPEPLTATTLPLIERQIACPGNYGATIFIVEHDEITEADTLHVYRIRRGKWSGRSDAQDRKIYPHRADKLFAMPVKAFAPALAWRMTRGGDVVGVSPVIEGVAI